MDVLTFIIELCKALAWPVALVVFAVLFRKPIAGLLDVRLRRLKLKEFEAEFEDALESAKGEVAKELPSAADSNTRQLPPAPEPEFDLVSMAPFGALVAAWTTVEAALSSAVTRAGIDLPRPRGAGQMLRALVQNDVIAEATARSVTGLQHLRNLAVHGGSDAQARVSREQAEEFITMVNAVCYSIEQNLVDYLQRKNAP